MSVMLPSTDYVGPPHVALSSETVATGLSRRVRPRRSMQPRIAALRTASSRCRSGGADARSAMTSRAS